MTAKPSIYALCDPETMALRYIGKADCPYRRLSRHLRDCRRRSTPVYAWVRKLLAAGLTPAMIVLAEECDDWKASESSLIARARMHGHRILNVADGGDRPFCPLKVRRENGLRAATRQGEVVFWLLRAFGRQASHFRSRGDVVRAERQMRAASVLRSMSHEQQEAFSRRWKEAGHWWPGKEKAGPQGARPD